MAALPPPRAGGGTGAVHIHPAYYDLEAEPGPARRAPRPISGPERGADPAGSPNAVWNLSSNTLHYDSYLLPDLYNRHQLPRLVPGPDRGHVAQLPSWDTYTGLQYGLPLGLPRPSDRVRRETDPLGPNVWRSHEEHIEHGKELSQRAFPRLVQDEYRHYRWLQWVAVTNPYAVLTDPTAILSMRQRMNLSGSPRFNYQTDFPKSLWSIGYHYWSRRRQGRLEPGSSDFKASLAEWKAQIFKMPTDYPGMLLGQDRHRDYIGESDDKEPRYYACINNRLTLQRNWVIPDNEAETWTNRRGIFADVRVYWVHGSEFEDQRASAYNASQRRLPLPGAQGVALHHDERDHHHGPHPAARAQAHTNNYRPFGAEPARPTFYYPSRYDVQWTTIDPEYSAAEDDFFCRPHERFRGCRRWSEMRAHIYRHYRQTADSKRQFYVLDDMGVASGAPAKAVKRFPFPPPAPGSAAARSGTTTEARHRMVPHWYPHVWEDDAHKSWQSIKKDAADRYHESYEMGWRKWTPDNAAHRGKMVPPMLFHDHFNGASYVELDLRKADLHPHIRVARKLRPEVPPPALNYGDQWPEDRFMKPWRPMDSEYWTRMSERMAKRSGLPEDTQNQAHALDRVQCAHLQDLAVLQRCGPHTESATGVDWNQRRPFLASKVRYKHYPFWESVTHPPNNMHGVDWVVCFPVDQNHRLIVEIMPDGVVGGQDRDFPLTEDGHNNDIEPEELVVYRYSKKRAWNPYHKSKRKMTPAMTTLTSIAALGTLQPILENLKEMEKSLKDYKDKITKAQEAQDKIDEEKAKKEKEAKERKEKREAARKKRKELEEKDPVIVTEKAEVVTDGNPNFTGTYPAPPGGMGPAGGMPSDYDSQLEGPWQSDIEGERTPGGGIETPGGGYVTPGGGYVNPAGDHVPADEFDNYGNDGYGRAGSFGPGDVPNYYDDDGNRVSYGGGGYPSGGYDDYGGGGGGGYGGGNDDYYSDGGGMGQDNYNDGGYGDDNFGDDNYNDGGYGDDNFGNGGSFRDGDGSFRDGDGSFRDGEGSFRDGEGSFRDGEGSFRDGEGSFRDGEGSFRDGEGSFRSGEGSFRDGEGSFRDGEGSNFDDNPAEGEFSDRGEGEFSDQMPEGEGDLSGGGSDFAGEEGMSAGGDSLGDGGSMSGRESALADELEGDPAEGDLSATDMGNITETEGEEPVGALTDTEAELTAAGGSIVGGSESGGGSIGGDTVRAGSSVSGSVTGMSEGAVEGVDDGVSEGVSASDSGIGVSDDDGVEAGSASGVGEESDIGEGSDIGESGSEGSVEAESLESSQADDEVGSEEEVERELTESAMSGSEVEASSESLEPSDEEGEVEDGEVTEGSSELVTEEGEEEVEESETVTGTGGEDEGSESVSDITEDEADEGQPTARTLASTGTMEPGDRIEDWVDGIDPNGDPGIPPLTERGTNIGDSDSGSEHDSDLSGSQSGGTSAPSASDMEQTTPSVNVSSEGVEGDESDVEGSRSDLSDVDSPAYGSALGTKKSTSEADRSDPFVTSDVGAATTILDRGVESDEDQDAVVVDEGGVTLIERDVPLGSLSEYLATVPEPEWLEPHDQVGELASDRVQAMSQSDRDLAVKEFERLLDSFGEHFEDPADEARRSDLVEEPEWLRCAIWWYRRATRELDLLKDILAKPELEPGRSELDESDDDETLVPLQDQVETGPNESSTSSDLTKSDGSTYILQRRLDAGADDMETMSSPTSTYVLQRKLDAGPEDMETVVSNKSDGRTTSIQRGIDAGSTGMETVVSSGSDDRTASIQRGIDAGSEDMITPTTVTRRPGNSDIVEVHEYLDDQSRHRRTSDPSAIEVHEIINRNSTEPSISAPADSDNAYAQSRYMSEQTRSDRPGHGPDFVRGATQGTPQRVNTSDSASEWTESSMEDDGTEQSYELDRTATKTISRSSSSRALSAERKNSPSDGSDSDQTVTRASRSVDPTLTDNQTESDHTTGRVKPASEDLDKQRIELEELQSRRIDLQQAHVDLLKALWILTEWLHDSLELPPRPYVVPLSKGQALLSRIIDRVCWMSLNGLLPSPDAAIQSFDPTIWIKYPQLQQLEDLEAVLDGRLVSDEAETEHRATLDHLPMIPLDTPSNLQMFVMVKVIQRGGYVLLAEDGSEMVMPCLFSIMRDTEHYRTSLALWSQKDMVNIRIAPDDTHLDDEEWHVWNEFTWLPDQLTTRLRLTALYTLSIQFEKQDYSIVRNLVDQTPALDHAFQPRPNERVVLTTQLVAGQYQPEGQQGLRFPGGPIRDCHLLVFERTRVQEVGIVPVQLHRGYRIALVSLQLATHDIYMVSFGFRKGAPLIYKTYEETGTVGDVRGGNSHASHDGDVTETDTEDETIIGTESSDATDRSAGEQSEITDITVSESGTESHSEGTSDGSDSTAKSVRQLEAVKGNKRGGEEAGDDKDKQSDDKSSADTASQSATSQSTPKSSASQQQSNKGNRLRGGHAESIIDIDTDTDRTVTDGTEQESDWVDETSDGEESTGDGSQDRQTVDGEDDKPAIQLDRYGTRLFALPESRRKWMFFQFNGEHSYKKFCSFMEGINKKEDEHQLPRPLQLVSYSVESANTTIEPDRTHYQWPREPGKPLGPLDGSITFINRTVQTGPHMPMTLLSDRLRVVMNNFDGGHFIDRMLLEPGELLVRLPATRESRLSILRRPQSTYSTMLQVDYLQTDPLDVRFPIADLIRRTPTLRRYEFHNYLDMHEFQRATTGHEVRFDAMCPRLAICNSKPARRALPRLLNRNNDDVATRVRIQVVVDQNDASFEAAITEVPTPLTPLDGEDPALTMQPVVERPAFVKILCFFDSFQYADALVLHVKASDTAHAQEVDKSGYRSVKLIGAQFRQPLKAPKEAPPTHQPQFNPLAGYADEASPSTAMSVTDAGQEHQPATATATETANANAAKLPGPGDDDDPWAAQQGVRHDLRSRYVNMDGRKDLDECKDIEIHFSDERDFRDFCRALPAQPDVAAQGGFLGLAPVAHASISAAGGGRRVVGAARGRVAPSERKLWRASRGPDVEDYY